MVFEIVHTFGWKEIVIYHRWRKSVKVVCKFVDVFTNKYDLCGFFCENV